MYLLETFGNKDFYLTDKGQIVRFDYNFKPEIATPSFSKESRIACKTVTTKAKGKFLRNGRCFSSMKEANNFLIKYLYHNGLISLSDYRFYTGNFSIS